MNTLIRDFRNNMAEVRKGIGKLAGSGLGKAGAKLAGKEVGKEVEGEVTKVTSKVAGRKAGEAVGKAVGDATGEVVGDLAKDVLSTEVGQDLVGEIVGPHPGRAICSFWQGKAEITFRVLALSGSLIALVTAAIAIGVAGQNVQQQGLNISNTTQEDLSRARRDLYGCAGYTILITLVAILVEMLLIGVRWCNIGGVNLAIHIFLTLDIILSCFFVVGHTAAGGAVLYCLIAYWSGSISTTEFGPGSAVRAVRYSLAVCVAACILSLMLYTTLATWSALFRAKEWNKKVIKYTIKQVEHELAHKAKDAIEEKLEPIKSVFK